MINMVGGKATLCLRRRISSQSGIRKCSSRQLRALNVVVGFLEESEVGSIDPERSCKIGTGEGAGDHGGIEDQCIRVVKRCHIDASRAVERSLGIV